MSERKNRSGHAKDKLLKTIYVPKFQNESNDPSNDAENLKTP